MPEKSMPEVMSDLAKLGLNFEVSAEKDGKLVLSAQAEKLHMTASAMLYLGELPSDRFFVGMLSGQLVVREL